MIFVFSRVYRNSSFYDAYWSVIPPLLLFYWWSQSGPGVDQLRCWLVAIVVLLWAIRLTANWVYGFPGLHHEDWRYPMFKERAGRWEFLADLFAIHLIPTVQVFVGMLPVYVAVTRPGDRSGLADVGGLRRSGWRRWPSSWSPTSRCTGSSRTAEPGAGDGPRAVELVAAPELLRRVQLLVRAGAVRRRGRAGRRVVAVRRRGR